MLNIFLYIYIYIINTILKMNVFIFSIVLTNFCKTLQLFWRYDLKGPFIPQQQKELVVYKE